MAQRQTPRFRPAAKQGGSKSGKSQTFPIGISSNVARKRGKGASAAKRGASGGNGRRSGGV